MRILIPSLIVFVWGTAVTIANLTADEPAASGAYESGRSAGQIFAGVLAVAGAAGILRWYKSRSA